MKIVFLAMVIFGAAPHHALACVKSTDGETLPGQGVERLADGEINPTCAWRWQKKPIRVAFDLGEARRKRFGRAPRPHWKRHCHEDYHRQKHNLHRMSPVEPNHDGDIIAYRAAKRIVQIRQKSVRS